MPAAFLRIAEELNVVSVIDKLVLEQTLRDFQHWQSIGLNVPRFSVNVSAKRLQDEELVNSLALSPSSRGRRRSSSWNRSFSTTATTW